MKETIKQPPKAVTEGSRVRIKGTNYIGVVAPLDTAELGFVPIIFDGHPDLPQGQTTRLAIGMLEPAPEPLWKVLQEGDIVTYASGRRKIYQSKFMGEVNTVRAVIGDGLAAGIQKVERPRALETVWEKQD